MSPKDRQAIVVCGLGFGDECKGSITDYLARKHKAHAVVRYNGGAQAAHNVVLSNDKHHTFSQFGSATFVPGVQTFLSHFMLINPIGMIREEEALRKQGVRDAFERTTVDGRALVITPFHTAVNRLRELSRGDNRRGSCGQGVGETVQDAKLNSRLAIRVTDLWNWPLLKLKLEHLQESALEKVRGFADRIPDNESAKRELLILNSDKTVQNCMSWYIEFSELGQVVPDDHIKHILHRQGTVIFEGAQGALLDEFHGFYPHVTWTNTTTSNAHALICEGNYNGKVTSYGLVRAYATRHGCGPFVTEDRVLTQRLTDEHNGMNEWQRDFRVGWFDLVAARYAIEVAGNIKKLVVSCLDQFVQVPQTKVCVAYTLRKFAGAQDFFSNVSESHGKIRIGKVKRTCLGMVHQEKLTKILGGCQPEYQTLPSCAPSDYVRFLHDQLGIPVTLVSTGPTEKDKMSMRL